MSESYTGVQKAAILLITLGPEKAATIFKHLKEDEIEELTLEIANTRSVSPQTKEEVLDEVNNKEKVEDSKEDIDSPKTYDNLYFYVILAMFSTAGIYLTRLKTKGKHFAK